MPNITDTAFDKLLAIYEEDRALWAAVYAMGEVCEYKSNFGERALRTLSSAHGINPDA